MERGQIALAASKAQGDSAADRHDIVGAGGRNWRPPEA